jgi:hypothetical protein
VGRRDAARGDHAPRRAGRAPIGVGGDGAADGAGATGGFRDNERGADESVSGLPASRQRERATPDDARWSRPGGQVVEVSEASEASEVERETRAGDDSENEDSDALQARISDEWRRYRERALRAAKRGQRVPEFVSDLLPRDEHARVAERLRTASTADDVRAIFAAARDESSVAVAAAPVSEFIPSTEPSALIVASPVTYDDPLQRLADALAARVEFSTRQSLVEQERALRELRTVVLDALTMEG